MTTLAAIASIDSGHDQRSKMWKAMRAGSVTASRFGDALDFLKTGKESAARREYRLQLIVERLTGIPKDGPRAKQMEWGTNTEPEARMAYELQSGNLVEEVGFQPHPTIEWCGVSPDGLVGDEGMIEIKCPNPDTHLKTWLLRSEQLAKILLGETAANPHLVPEEHLPQIQGNLWVLNRKWCDFISYDPRFPEPMRLYVQRVERDDAYIAKLEAGLVKFLKEINDAMTMILGVTE